MGVCGGMDLSAQGSAVVKDFDRDEQLRQELREFYGLDERRLFLRVFGWVTVMLVSAWIIGGLLCVSH